jgi:hypothetical protein
MSAACINGLTQFLINLLTLYFCYMMTYKFLYSFNKTNEMH